MAGVNRRRSNCLILADQKDAEAEFKSMKNVDTGSVAAENKNGEDSELIARPGYEGDGGGESAVWH